MEVRPVSHYHQTCIPITDGLTSDSSIRIVARLTHQRNRQDLQFLVIAEGVKTLEFWMEDADEVVEKPVGTEGGFLVERGAFDIAAIDILLAEGIELVVAVMFSTKFCIGDVVVTAVAEEPDISLARLLQDSLEGKGYGTAVLILCPRVVTACVLNHLTDGALTAWHIPDTAGHLVEKDGLLKFEI